MVENRVLDAGNRKQATQMIMSSLLLSIVGSFLTAGVLFSFLHLSDPARYTYDLSRWIDIAAASTAMVGVIYLFVSIRRWRCMNFGRFSFDDVNKIFVYREGSRKKKQIPYGDIVSLVVSDFNVFMCPIGELRNHYKLIQIHYNQKISLRGSQWFRCEKNEAVADFINAIDLKAPVVNFTNLKIESKK